MSLNPKKHWYEFTPEEAVGLDLSVELDISAPHNENGERCPWPWLPEQLGDAPIGQFHCEYCGAMVLAGVRHLDYKDFDTDIEAALLHVKLDE